jgi:hypothetical protein
MVTVSLRAKTTHISLADSMSLLSHEISGRIGSPRCASVHHLVHRPSVKPVVHKLPFAMFAASVRIRLVVINA